MLLACLLAMSHVSSNPDKLSNHCEAIASCAVHTPGCINLTSSGQWQFGGWQLCLSKHTYVQTMSIACCQSSTKAPQVKAMAGGAPLNSVGCR